MNIILNRNDIVCFVKKNLIHLSFILDGNGRWAEKNNEKRTFGHKKSINSLKEIITEAFELGIKYISLFGFSTENWKRNIDEINEIFISINDAIIMYYDSFMEGKIKFKIIGDRTNLPNFLIETISRVEKDTEKNSNFFLYIALNYGGKWDILNAINNILKKKEYIVIDENIFRSFLSTSEIPDPDLLIRTGNEMRISNYFLYQLSYSELYFSQVLCPDFSKKDLYDAIDNFMKRKRKFGAINC